MQSSQQLEPGSTKAPGKIILSGEYAVLRGHPALAFAVNRFVSATCSDRERKQGSYFLQEVISVLAKKFGSTHPAPLAARTIICDSSALRDGQTKLGLGSSAAVTVAAIHEALRASQTAMPSPVEIQRLAHQAHRQAQQRLGAGGSGVDVAASTFGSVIAATPSKPGAPCQIEVLQWPSSLVLCPIWLGHAASTPQFISAIKAAGTAVDSAIEDIGTASRTLIRAFRDPSAGDAIEAIRLGHRAISKLGQQAHTTIVPDAMRPLVAMSESIGGAMKTTGAGGGDIALAVLPNDEKASKFRAYARSMGQRPLDLAIARQGVHPAFNQAIPAP